MARRKGWRAVKSGFSYTPDEAARNQGVAKGTVLRWLKSGLTHLRDQRPFLILGGDLVAFLKALKKPKRKLAPNEYYCFKCKAPRKPAFGEVEYCPRTSQNGMARALCIDCSTVMQKSTSLGMITALQRTLKVSFPHDHEPLNKGVKPCSNDHFERE